MTTKKTKNKECECEQGIYHTGRFIDTETNRPFSEEICTKCYLPCHQQPEKECECGCEGHNKDFAPEKIWDKKCKYFPHPKPKEECEHEIVESEENHCFYCKKCKEAHGTRELFFIPHPEPSREKLQSEAAIFWSKIAEYLPKSLERSALGDEKIYRAFFQAYTEFRPVLLLSERTALVERLKVDMKKANWEKQSIDEITNLLMQQ